MLMRLACRLDKNYRQDNNLSKHKDEHIKE